jgi:hypothetical protein
MCSTGAFGVEILSNKISSAVRDLLISQSVLDEIRSCRLQYPHRAIPRTRVSISDPVFSCAAGRPERVQKDYPPGKSDTNGSIFWNKHDGSDLLTSLSTQIDILYM